MMSSCISSRSFIVLVYTFRFMIGFTLISLCVSCKLRVFFALCITYERPNPTASSSPWPALEPSSRPPGQVWAGPPLGPRLPHRSVCLLWHDVSVSITACDWPWNQVLQILRLCCFHTCFGYFKSSARILMGTVLILEINLWRLAA